MQAVKQNLDSLRQFIKQISKISLLTQEEVLGYAKQVQRMRHLLELKQELSRRHSREPSCTQWATQAQLTETALKASLQEGQKAALLQKQTSW